MKAQGPNTSSSAPAADQENNNPEEPEVDDEGEQARKRQERKERAVKEREAKVKVERGRVEADIGRSRQGLDKEEGEREFRCASSISLLCDSTGGVDYTSHRVFQDYADRCHPRPKCTSIVFTGTAA